MRRREAASQKLVSPEQRLVPRTSETGCVSGVWDREVRHQTMTLVVAVPVPLPAGAVVAQRGNVDSGSCCGEFVVQLPHAFAVRRGTECGDVLVRVLAKGAAEHFSRGGGAFVDQERQRAVPELVSFTSPRLNQRFPAVVFDPSFLQRVICQVPANESVLRLSVRAASPFSDFDD